MANVTSTKKRLSATVYYLLAGIILSWPPLLTTGRLLSEWGNGKTTSLLSLAVIHLLVLGSMLTIAFGVLYQIVPIAFQAPPVPRHVLMWHLPLHILCVITMVSGFLLGRFQIVGIGGAALFCSTIAYFTLIGRSYLRARNKTPVHKGLSLPFVALWLVLLVGIFQAFLPGLVSESLIQTHVLLGGFAFWGGLVLVFSYKLMPMFAISHGYKASLPRSAAFYFSGVLLYIATSWLPETPLRTVCGILSGVLMIVGLLAFGVDMIAIVRSRKRRRLVLPLYDAFVASLFFAIGQIGIALSSIFHSSTWFYASVYLFAFGGLIGLMFSYMQKIVPFLWFEYRFSKRPERKTAPLIDDMVSKRTSQIGMLIYFVGVIAGSTRMLIQPQQPGAVLFDWGSAACLTGGSVVLFLALQHVLTIGGKRPPDSN